MTKDAYAFYKKCLSRGRWRLLHLRRGRVDVDAKLFLKAAAYLDEDVVVEMKGGATLTGLAVSYDDYPSGVHYRIEDERESVEIDPRAVSQISLASDSASVPGRVAASGARARPSNLAERMAAC